MFTLLILMMQSTIILAQEKSLLSDLSLEEVMTFGKHSKRKFGKTKKSAVKYQTYQCSVKLNINTDELIDFNNISFVDISNKKRYRPNNINLRYDNVNVIRVKISDYKFEDTFIKYSQEGIENFDPYEYGINSVGGLKKESARKRLMPVLVEASKKKYKKVHFFFAAELDNSGSFSIYWKDKLIGEVGRK